MYNISTNKLNSIMNIYKQKILKRVKNFLFQPDLSQEAFEAYYHRLPEKINVDWVRDGKYIIGKVVADEYKFTTQGESVEDFVEMVNDSIYTVNGVPFEYIDAIKKAKAYNPPLEVLQQLGDLSISKNTISLIKNTEQTLQLA
jgi:hypothetical protein